MTRIILLAHQVKVQYLSMIWPSVALSWDRCHIAYVYEGKRGIGTQVRFSVFTNGWKIRRTICKVQRGICNGLRTRRLVRMTESINRRIAGRSFYKNNTIHPIPPIPPTCHTFQQAICSELLNRTTISWSLLMVGRGGLAGNWLAEWRWWGKLA